MGDGRSDLSDALIDADAGTTVDVVHPDGTRRRLTVTTAESRRLKDAGRDVTSDRDRLIAHPYFAGAVKFLGAALAGAAITGLLGNWFTDVWSDREHEIELEAQLLTDITEASMVVYQQAQNTARLPDTDPERCQARNAAADTWSYTTHAKATPVFRTYYQDDVSHTWFEFQDAMYQWAVLAGCTRDEASRRVDLNQIRTYVEDHTDRDIAPTADEWEVLAVEARPNEDAYRSVGLAMLRGTKALRETLRDAEPDFD